MAKKVSKAVEVVATQPTSKGLGQLATRIDSELHREVKLYCVGNGVSIMEFVEAALKALLAGSKADSKKARK